MPTTSWQFDVFRQRGRRRWPLTAVDARSALEAPLLTRAMHNIAAQVLSPSQSALRSVAPAHNQCLMPYPRGINTISKLRLSVMPTPEKPPPERKKHDDEEETHSYSKEERLVRMVLFVIFLVLAFAIFVCACGSACLRACVCADGGSLRDGLTDT